MAAEGNLKINVVPQVSGLDDLIDQLRRTGAALEGLADSLQALSDGGPDAARTLPENDLPGFDFGTVSKDHQAQPPVPLSAMICPWILSRKDHDAHRFEINMDVDSPGISSMSFDCPGRPVRPWHGH